MWLIKLSKSMDWSSSLTLTIININIVLILLTIINLSHMSEAAPAAQKNKKIAKAGPGRQVRLWVRAKFLGFRRYIRLHSDQKSNKMFTKPSLDLRVLTIAQALNTTSERELHTFTKLIQEKLRTDSEYLLAYLDHLGKNFNKPRKLWCCSC